jgi:hypothetical protein
MPFYQKVLNNQNTISVVTMTTFCLFIQGIYVQIYIKSWTNTWIFFDPLLPPTPHPTHTVRIDGVLGFPAKRIFFLSVFQNRSETNPNCRN